MIKQRNIGICILLSIVTCGIYGLYWFVVLTDDINQESGETDATSGGMSLLLTIVTCNIYGWFWAYKMGEKVDIIKNKNGVPSSNSGILYVLLQVFGLGIIAYALMQDTANKYAEAIPQMNTGYGQQTYTIRMHTVSRDMIRMHTTRTRMVSSRDMIRMHTASSSITRMRMVSSSMIRMRTIRTRMVSSSIIRIHIASSLA